MMATLQTIRGGDPPIRVAGRPACANGHPWRAETTRWRLRVREERIDGGQVRAARAGWERDCLICKQKAEGLRREQAKARRRYT